MEKTKETVIEVKDVEHSFYCDGCEKYLGASKEYEDGWYQKFGAFEESFCVDHNWYRIERCFCDDCKKSFIKKIEAALESLGFEKK